MTTEESRETLHEETEPRDVRVAVYCPTGATLPPEARVIINVPGDKATIRFRHASARETLCIARQHDLPGLIAIADLPSRTGDLLDHAFHATTICDGLMSTAFAITLADMRQSFPVLACDNTPGLQDRPFIHFFPDQLVMGRRERLDPNQWLNEGSSMIKTASHRIIRAIRWLRKMHTEDDILDRFLAGWTGLETLNPDLCKHFGVAPFAEDVQPCGNCGAELVRKVARSNGLKQLFVHEGHKKAYDACSRARNGLVHGFRTITEVTTIAREHASVVGQMLAKGIRLLSRIPVPTDADKFKWLGGDRVASFMFVEGTINCGELDDYEKRLNELPLLEYVIRHEGAVVDEKTVLNITTNIPEPPDCTLNNIRLVVSGPVAINNVQTQ